MSLIEISPGIAVRKTDIVRIEYEERVFIPYLCSNEVTSRRLFVYVLRNGKEERRLYTGKDATKMAENLDKNGVFENPFIGEVKNYYREDIF